MGPPKLFSEFETSAFQQTRLNALPPFPTELVQKSGLVWLLGRRDNLSCFYFVGDTFNILSCLSPLSIYTTPVSLSLSSSPASYPPPPLLLPLPSSLPLQLNLSTHTYTGPTKKMCKNIHFESKYSLTFTSPSVGRSVGWNICHNFL